MGGNKYSREGRSNYAGRCLVSALDCVARYRLLHDEGKFDEEDHKYSKEGMSVYAERCLVAALDCVARYRLLHEEDEFDEEEDKYSREGKFDYQEGEFSEKEGSGKSRRNLRAC